MLRKTIHRAFMISPAKAKRILNSHDQEASARGQPAFILQFAKYRYSLRQEYAHIISQYLRVPADQIDLSIGLADTSQTKGIHKCVEVRTPRIPPESLKALRDAIRTKSDRNFLELHIVGTRDVPKAIPTDYDAENSWSDAVSRAAEKIMQINALVIVQHSPESAADAKHMRAASLKFSHIPAVFDLQEDLPGLLKESAIEIPTEVPPSVQRRLGICIDSYSAAATGPFNEHLFRKSILDYFYAGGLWNSAYFMHNGVCLGCRKQFDYLFQTRQIERMLKKPNDTMYSGLRYQRHRHFARPRHLIGYKRGRPLSNTTSLQRPLG